MRLRSRPQEFDTIVDPQVAISSFVKGMARPEKLEGGAPGRHELVRRMFDALSRRDIAAIGNMSLSRSEYGHFYYPTSLYSRKPYELPPDVAWMLSSESSAKGARRLVARLGDRKLELLGLTCGRTEHEGENEIQSDCTVSYSDSTGRVETRRLFRSLIIRDGAAKFFRIQATSERNDSVTGTPAV